MLNSRLSCRTLQRLKEKKTRKLTKPRCLAVILSQMYPLFHELLVTRKVTLIRGGR